MSGTIRVASFQYPIEFIRSWSHFKTKIETHIQQAVQNKANILLFPEYACMELVSIFPKTIYSDIMKQKEFIQQIKWDYLSLHQILAQKYEVFIVASSYPEKISDGSFRNRAYIFSPDGLQDFQDKLIMNRFETRWEIQGGDQIKIFKTRIGSYGIITCYDSEFPMIARSMAEGGAQILLVPSCTDTLSGYYRVRIACLARALENQCFVVQSPTVGKAYWTEILDENYGAAGFYTPPTKNLPDDGILAIGRLNESGWVFADLKLNIIEDIRANGETLNYTDWANQFRIVPKSVQIEL